MNTPGVERSVDGGLGEPRDNEWRPSEPAPTAQELQSSRARSWILSLTLLATLGSAGLAFSLGSAAISAAHALKTGDADRLRSSGLDWNALRSEVEASLAQGAPDDLSPGAARYLAHLRNEVAITLATPEGLAEAIQARLTGNSRPPEPSSVGALGIGFDLYPNAGQMPVVSFVLGPTLHPPGWRIVHVELHGPREQQGFEPR